MGDNCPEDMGCDPIIIDLGCGERPADDATVLVDWREFPYDNFVRCDLGNLPLPFIDSCANKVYLRHVIEHFSREYAQQLLLDIWRILKPNGFLSIDTPNIYAVIKWVVEQNNRDFEDENIPAWGSPAQAVWSKDLYPGAYHKYGYSDVTLTRLLDDVGFEIVQHNDYSTYALIVNARKIT